MAGLSLAAAGATAVGNALLVTATVCDLTSIAVDYLGRRHDAEKKGDPSGSTTTPIRSGENGARRVRH